VVSLIGQPPYDGDAVAPPFPQLTDPITGLLTRDGLIAASLRTEAGAAVIFIDFDNFRRINAAHGRSTGNAVLAELARRLRVASPDNALVARMGRDEFIVVLPGGGAEHAQVVAQQLLETTGRPVHVGRQKIRLTAAIGIAEIDASSDLETALLQSDVAMSHAKHRPNQRQIKIYSSYMSELAVERLTIEAELRDALELEQLRLFYQPVVDLATGRIYEVEALLRWQHPERGLLEPGEFLPMAEQLGLMGDIGRWVLLMACRQGRQWQDTHLGARQIMVAVNLSPAQVRDPNLSGDVRAVLEETGFRPSLLRFEISESVTHEDLDPAILAIHALRGLGVLISLDDFGAGYAGWRFLQHCPIDGIKIDRSLLVARDEANPGHPGMVEAVMAFATQLGIPVGVEGIERIEQAEAMHKLGILTAQGFYFAHPEPAEIIAPSLALAQESQCLS
jgi:diguanylate cyclase (GGDEF)-like protein